eukprot:3751600-Prymnesium_polylepis.1
MAERGALRCSKGDIAAKFSLQSSMVRSLRPFSRSLCPAPLAPPSETPSAPALVHRRRQQALLRHGVHAL